MKRLLTAFAIAALLASQCRALGLEPATRV